MANAKAYIEGTVIAIENGQATVEITGCESCGGCRICATFGDSSKRLVVNAIPGLRIQQRVRIEGLGTSSWLGTFLVFVVPVVGLILGIILGQVIPVAGLSPDTFSLLLGLGLLGLGFTGAHLYERAVLRPQPFAPYIAQVLD